MAISLDSDNLLFPIYNSIKFLSSGKGSKDSISLSSKDSYIKFYKLANFFLKKMLNSLSLN